MRSYKENQHRSRLHSQRRLQLSDRWLISAPAWGERCLDLLCRVTIPAIRAALAHTHCQHILVIHTDEPDRVKAAAAGLNIQTRRLYPSENPFERLSFGHRDTVMKAGLGDFIMLLTADMVISENALTACEAQFHSGRLFVGINATRALDNVQPPVGLSSRELSAWGWDHRNPMTRECTWPHGHAEDATRLYFPSDSGDDVVCRMRLVHPLAIVVDGREVNLKFTPSIDCKLHDGYASYETHIVTDPDELTVVELSPTDKGFGCVEKTLLERVTFGDIQITHPLYVDRLRHRIVIKGTGKGCSDGEAISQITNGQIAASSSVSVLSDNSGPDWLVVIPVWGPSGHGNSRHIGTFIRACLPATVEAAKCIGSKMRFMIPTDVRDQLGPVLNAAGVDYFFQNLPNEHNDHTKMTLCHRMACAEARQGEAIAFINADMVCSIETFSAAQTAFNAGKRMILMAGTRTLSEDLPPIGANSVKLLRWVWANRHPWISGCIWGEGKTVLPAQLFFHWNDDVVLHGFHLHPFAVLKERPLNFSVTIDYNLGQMFQRNEIHVVQNATEAAFAEMSPVSRDFGYHSSVISITSIVKWAACTLPDHRWLFSLPIAIQGNGEDIGDRAVVADILKVLGGYVPMPNSKHDQGMSMRSQQRAMQR